MRVSGYVSTLGITWTNAAVALGAAVLAFVALHGAVMLFRRRLDQLQGERAHKPIVDVLRHTLAKTSSLAILATSVLIGLSVLDLAPPWHERIGHLWFVTLGVQLAVYLHRAIGRGTSDPAAAPVHLPP